MLFWYSGIKVSFFTKCKIALYEAEKLYGVLELNSFLTNPKKTNIIIWNRVLVIL